MPGKPRINRGLLGQIQLTPFGNDGFNPIRLQSPANRRTDQPFVACNKYV
jgi:hypothetical protein